MNNDKSFTNRIILLALSVFLFGAIPAGAASHQPTGSPAHLLAGPPADPPAQGTSNLLYSAYLGGSGNDCFPNCAIAVDAGGSVYVAGSTASKDFAGLSGALQPSNQNGDIFIAKLKPDGSAFEYLYFLGGSGSDYATAIAVDSAGSAYVTGYTASKDFPLTAGVFGGKYRGGYSDAFVAKLKPDGSGLVYASYLGGDDTDRAYGLAVDRSGSVYLTGETRSANFPVTANAPQSQHSGDSDAFAVKISADGSEIRYATFIGGQKGEQGQALALDLQGQAYIAGKTTSSDFPATNDALAVKPSGLGDAFIVKLSANGDVFLYATYLGGSSVDGASAIALDADGGAYVTGSTVSQDFPVTQSAFDTSPNKSYDVFIAKLSPNGSALDYAAYLGGRGSDRAYAIAVDNAGSAFVTGATYSQNFPVTKDAFDPTYNYGYADAFLAKLKPDGSALDYATFLGGSEPDTGAALAVDGEGSIYVAGGTLSPTFPVTVGSVNPEYKGGWDGFAAKVIFSGKKGTSMISGIIRDQQGKPVPGAVVSAGGRGSASTDANGVYVLIGLDPGIYTLSPVKAGYTFSPARRTVNVPTDQALLVFVGVPQGDPPAPFLELPLDYDGAVSTFALALQDTDAQGWVTSWFDHAYPDYAKNKRLTPADGITRSKDPYNLGLGCYERRCYDGHDGTDLVYRNFQPGLTQFQGVKIRAAAAGEVAVARSGCAVGDRWCGGGLGNQVLLAHPNGYYTLYGHLASLSVKKGQQVAAGDSLGVMGNTGNASGAHLHFGVYKDDGNGEWDGPESDRLIDPFGWRGAQADPWVADRQGPVSDYLWKQSLVREKVFAGARGLILNDSANSVGVTVAAGALPGQANLELYRGSVPNAVGGKRSAGVSFELKALEWLPGGAVTPDSEGRVSLELALNQPIGLNLSYTQEAARHLDVDQLQVYHWDAKKRVWQSAPSTVDPEARLVSAKTTSLGQFDLQAPLLCPADAVEPDDNYFSSREITPNGAAITRLFDTPEDEDWFYFAAQQGTQYVIETANLSAGVDTHVELYDLASGSLLASNDDGGAGKASLLRWKSPRAGTFFLRVLRVGDDSAFGCRASYSLGVSYDFHQIYLPLVLKD
ncbi:MAG TPA: peptidoglycan DD-metalloendopeptidase family protein [Chloroflexi bacterium]|nr:peptidoglycan DD-metalloendopeptidase family protein [Chloroflexota bacterium]